MDHLTVFKWDFKTQTCQKIIYLTCLNFNLNSLLRKKILNSGKTDYLFQFKPIFNVNLKKNYLQI